MDAIAQARLAIVQPWAAKYTLDSALVAAVCEQESSFDTYAVRWEQAFYDHYIYPLKLADITEARCRAMSWGYMQVIGQVAREHGFSGRFLSQLCAPDQGLDIGCEVLRAKIALAMGDITGIIHLTDPLQ